MNTLSIYRAGVILETFNVEQGCVQTKQIMGDNAISLTFTLSHYTDFQFGDEATVYGELYKLNSVPAVKKVSSNLWQYTLKMEAEYYDLSKAQFLFLGPTNILRETDFSLVGTAKDFLDLIIQNALRVSAGWTRGDVVNTVYKNLDFSNENCLQALQRLAEAFETEFWVEGKKIHLSKRRFITDRVFKQGRNRGLININRQVQQGTKVVTRLYAQGSDRNLPVNYRSGAQRLKMEGGIDYIEQNTSVGIIEDSAIFNDVYPHRTGKVTAIGTDIYTFFDTNVNFDLNQYLLPGVEAKLTFNTGQLAGYTFKISQYHAASKKFKILKNDEEKTLEIPSASLRPAVGDEYVIFDIQMPQYYITQAERKLKTEATKLLQKLSQVQYSYTVEVDPLYMKRRNLRLQIGQVITIQDDDLEIDQEIAIVSCTRSLQNEWSYTVELSDEKVAGTLSQIQNTQASNSREIQTIKNAYASITDNKVIGDLKVLQGTGYFDAMPPIQGPLTDYAVVYLNRQTNKLHRAP